MKKEIDYASLEIVVDGAYPDFCDSYAEAGYYTDGTELSEGDLEAIDLGIIYELIIDKQLFIK